MALILDIPIPLRGPEATYTELPFVAIQSPKNSSNSSRRPKEIIARRVARELRDGMLVNLGIGLPTLVAHYVPAGINVAFQSENGIIGFGAPPRRRAWRTRI